MTLSDETGTLKRFRKTLPRFQQTFKTPLQNLDPFVSAILSASEARRATATIEHVVFEPKHLFALLESHSIPPQPLTWRTLTATVEGEVAPLLKAAFSDWVDFLFVPEPKSFTIYADHDEYTTVFAHSRSNLNRVTGPLTTEGFEAALQYARRF
jgi:hypothetical protein